jgi:RNA polymerase sigma-70 factor (ECF subfamily)
VQPDDAAILRGLADGELWARAAFFDRYAARVERIVRKALGFEMHVDFADVVQEAFAEALSSVAHVRDAQALPAWMKMIAARAAYKTMRTRRARRWLRFLEPELVPEVTVEGIEPELLEAHRRTYQVLNRLPADERLAFALRHIEGMELTEVADACEVSLSTIKRRLARAEQRFVKAAAQDEVLSEWLKEGGRWST